MKVTAHLAQRMTERAIKLRWVEDAIASPDWTVPDPDPTLVRSFKAITEMNGRILRGVHRPIAGDDIAVTAFFDGAARRRRI